ncbi:MAG: GNAT family N-acetyltransferase [Candidatus Omnitrophica bacterium]|nr:GNAT family N-acetyltransferase [Candidatus Omnitrophota bacterium]
MEKAWASRTPLELSSTSSNRPAGPGSINALDVESFDLPEELAHIRSIDNANSGKTVIHIQDAHCNYFAQHKINDIIEHLSEEYGISSINLEGGKGAYDLSVFTGIADGRIREKVADYFVKEGIVNGGEYFAINNPDKASLWGIENTKLYLENLKLTKNSLKHKDAIDKYLKSLEHVLNNLRRNIYSKELLEFDENYVNYRENTFGFKDYLSYLIKTAKEENIDTEAFPNIYLLEESFGQEDGMDFKEVTRERKKLIDEFQKILSKRALEEIILKTVQFKTKKISQYDFHAYLFEKAKSVGINLNRFPQFQKYISCSSKYKAIDKSKIMKEIDSLKDVVKAALLTNDKQRELSALHKNFTLIRGMFNLAITNDDYRYYKENKDSFRIKNFTAFIEKEAPLYRITARPDENMQELDRHVKNMAECYECTFKRDEAFLKNIKLKDTAILITGGFHSGNLAKLFKRNNISYIGILPNFKTKKGYESPYFSLLAGKETKLDKFLNKAISYTTQHSALAISSLFSQMGVVDIKDRNQVSLKAQILAAVFSNKPFTIGTLIGWDIVISPSDIPENPYYTYTEETEGLTLTAGIYKQPTGQRDAEGADIILADLVATPAEVKEPYPIAAMAKEASPDSIQMTPVSPMIAWNSTRFIRKSLAGILTAILALDIFVHESGHIFVYILLHPISSFFGGNRLTIKRILDTYRNKEFDPPIKDRGLKGILIGSGGPLATLVVSGLLLYLGIPAAKEILSGNHAIYMYVILISTGLLSLEFAFSTLECTILGWILGKETCDLSRIIALANYKKWEYARELKAKLLLRPGLDIPIILLCRLFEDVGCNDAGSSRINELFNTANPAQLQSAIRELNKELTLASYARDRKAQKKAISNAIAKLTSASDISAESLRKDDDVWASTKGEPSPASSKEPWWRSIGRRGFLRIAGAGIASIFLPKERSIAADKTKTTDDASYTRIKDRKTGAVWESVERGTKISAEEHPRILAGKDDRFRMIAEPDRKSVDPKLNITVYDLHKSVSWMAGYNSYGKGIREIGWDREDGKVAAELDLAKTEDDGDGHGGFGIDVEYAAFPSKDTSIDGLTEHGSHLVKHRFDMRDGGFKVTFEVIPDKGFEDVPLMEFKIGVWSAVNGGQMDLPKNINVKKGQKITMEFHPSASPDGKAWTGKGFTGEHASWVRIEVGFCSDVEKGTRFRGKLKIHKLEVTGKEPVIKNPPVESEPEPIKTELLRKKPVQVKKPSTIDFLRYLGTGGYTSPETYSKVFTDERDGFAGTAGVLVEKEFRALAAMRNALARKFPDMKGLKDLKFMDRRFTFANLESVKVLEDGTVVIDHKVAEKNIRAYCELLRKYKIRGVPVLFDYLLARTHPELFLDRKKRANFLMSIEPELNILKQYSDVIRAIEPMNEPDVDENAAGGAERYLVGFTDPVTGEYRHMPLWLRQDFVADVATSIREQTNLPVSFSAVSRETLKYWIHLMEPGDLANFHYYTKPHYTGDDVKELRGFDSDKAGREWLNISPEVDVIVGEYQPVDMYNRPLFSHVLRNTRRRGYSGALPWWVHKDFPIDLHLKAYMDAMKEVIESDKTESDKKAKPAEAKDGRTLSMNISTPLLFLAAIGITLTFLAAPGFAAAAGEALPHAGAGLGAWSGLDIAKIIGIILAAAGGIWVMARWWHRRSSKQNEIKAKSLIDNASLPERELLNNYLRDAIKTRKNLSVFIHDLERYLDIQKTFGTHILPSDTKKMVRDIFGAAIQDLESAGGKVTFLVKNYVIRVYYMHPLRHMLNCMIIGESEAEMAALANNDKLVARMRNVLNQPMDVVERAIPLDEAVGIARNKGDENLVGLLENAKRQNPVIDIPLIYAPIYENIGVVVRQETDGTRKVYVVAFDLEGLKTSIEAMGIERLPEEIDGYPTPEGIPYERVARTIEKITELSADFAPEQEFPELIAPDSRKQRSRLITILSAAISKFGKTLKTLFNKSTMILLSIILLGALATPGFAAGLEKAPLGQVAQAAGEPIVGLFSYGATIAAAIALVAVAVGAVYYIITRSARKDPASKLRSSLINNPHDVRTLRLITDELQTNVPEATAHSCIYVLRELLINPLQPTQLLISNISKVYGVDLTIGDIKEIYAILRNTPKFQDLLSYESARPRALSMFREFMGQDQSTIQAILDGKIVPQVLEIHPSSFCLLRCAHCFNATRLTADGELIIIEGGPPISIAGEERRIEVIDQFIGMGVKKINLSGSGEPFYESLQLYVDEIRNRGSDIYLSIYTNGELLSESDIEMCVLKVNRLFFSIDAATPETFGALKLEGAGRREMEHRYGRIVETIRRSVELRNERALAGETRLRIGMGFVVGEQNYQEVDDFILLAKDLGIDFVNFTAIQGKGEYNTAILEVLEKTYYQRKNGKINGVSIFFDDKFSQYIMQKEMLNASDVIPRESLPQMHNCPVAAGNLSVAYSFGSDTVYACITKSQPANREPQFELFTGTDVETDTVPVLLQRKQSDLLPIDPQECLYCRKADVYTNEIIGLLAAERNAGVEISELPIVYGEDLYSEKTGLTAKDDTSGGLSPTNFLTLGLAGIVLSIIRDFNEDEEGSLDPKRKTLWTVISALAMVLIIMPPELRSIGWPVAFTGSIALVTILAVRLLNYYKVRLSKRVTKGAALGVKTQDVDGATIRSLLHLLRSEATKEAVDSLAYIMAYYPDTLEDARALCARELFNFASRDQISQDVREYAVDTMFNALKSDKISGEIRELLQSLLIRYYDEVDGKLTTSPIDSMLADTGGETDDTQPPAPLTTKATFKKALKKLGKTEDTTWEDLTREEKLFIAKYAAWREIPQTFLPWFLFLHENKTWKDYLYRSLGILGIWVAMLIPVLGVPIIPALLANMPYLEAVYTLAPITGPIALLLNWLTHRQYNLKLGIKRGWPMLVEGSTKGPEGLSFDKNSIVNDLDVTGVPIIKYPDHMFVREFDSQRVSASNTIAIVETGIVPRYMTTPIAARVFRNQNGNLEVEFGRLIEDKNKFKPLSPTSPSYKDLRPVSGKPDLAVSILNDPLVGACARMAAVAEPARDEKQEPSQGQDGRLKGSFLAAIGVIVASLGIVLSKIVLSSYMPEVASGSMQEIVAVQYMFSLAFFASVWMSVAYLISYLVKDKKGERKSIRDVISPEREFYEKLDVKDKRLVFWGSVFAHIICGASFHFGLSLVNVRTAAFASQAAVIFGLLLGRFILKESITPRKLIGNALTLIGVLTVVSFLSNGANTGMPGLAIIGIVAVVISALSLAIRQVIHKTFFSRQRESEESNPQAQLLTVKYGYKLAATVFAAVTFVLYLSGASAFSLILHPLLIFGTAILFPLSYYFMYKAQGIKGFGVTHLAPIAASGTILLVLLEGSILGDWPVNLPLLIAMGGLVTFGTYIANGGPIVSPIKRFIALLKKFHRDEKGETILGPSSKEGDDAYDITDPGNYITHDISSAVKLGPDGKLHVFDPVDLDCLSEYPDGWVLSRDVYTLSILAKIYEAPDGQLFFAYNAEDSGILSKRGLNNEIDVFKRAQEVGFDNLAEIRVLQDGTTLTKITDTYSNGEILERHTSFEDLLLLTVFFNDIDRSVVLQQNLYERNISGRKCYLAYDLGDSELPVAGIQESLDSTNRHGFVVELNLSERQKTDGINWDYMRRRTRELNMSPEQRDLLLAEINAIEGMTRAEAEDDAEMKAIGERAPPLDEDMLPTEARKMNEQAAAEEPAKDEKPEPSPISTIPLVSGVEISMETIKDATNEEELRELLWSSFAFGRPWIDRMINTMKNPRAVTFIARANGKIVGCVTCAEPGKADKKKYITSINAEEAYYLVGIATRKGYEGKGIARGLLSASIGAVAETGQYRYFTLHSRGEKRLVNILYSDCADMMVEEAKRETKRGRLFVLDLQRRYGVPDPTAHIPESDEGGIGVSEAGILPHRRAGNLNDCIVETLGDNLEAIAEAKGITPREYKAFQEWYQNQGKSGDDVPKDKWLPIEKLAQGNYITIGEGKKAKRLWVVELPVDKLGEVNGQPFTGHVGFTARNKNEGIIWVAAGTKELPRDRIEVELEIMHEEQEYRIALDEAQRRHGWDIQKMSDWRDGDDSSGFSYLQAMRFFTKAHKMAWRNVVDICQEESNVLNKTVPFAPPRSDKARAHRMKRIKKEKQLEKAKEYWQKAEEIEVEYISPISGIGITASKEPAKSREGAEAAQDTRGPLDSLKLLVSVGIENEYFMEAVKHFNDDVLVPREAARLPFEPLTWEKLLNLYELYRGDNGNPEYTAAIRAERLRSLNERLPADMNILDVANRQYENEEELFEAAADLYIYIAKRQILLEHDEKVSQVGKRDLAPGLPGFDKITEQHKPPSATQTGIPIPHTASGHYRLAFFVVQYLLANNGYAGAMFTEATEPGNEGRYGYFFVRRASAKSRLVDLLRSRVTKTSAAEAINTGYKPGGVEETWQRLYQLIRDFVSELAESSRAITEIDIRQLSYLYWTAEHGTVREILSFELALPIAPYRSTSIGVEDFDGNIVAQFDNHKVISQQVVDFLKWINLPHDTCVDPRSFASLGEWISDKSSWEDIDLGNPSTHAAIAFWLFHQVIHPFYDGNTRTGWDIMNILRRRAGLEPVELPRDREEQKLYFKTFSKEQNPRRFLEWFRRLEDVSRAASPEPARGQGKAIPKLFLMPGIGSTNVTPDLNKWNAILEMIPQLEAIERPPSPLFDVKGGIYAASNPEWIRAFIAMLGIDESKTVLEIGTGRGESAAFFTTAGARVHTIEIKEKTELYIRGNLEMIAERAEIPGEQLTFEIADVLNTDVSSYDVIYFYFTFPDTPKNKLEDGVPFAMELLGHLRSMKPGACFAVAGLPGAVFENGDEIGKYFDYFKSNNGMLTVFRRNDYRDEPAAAEPPQVTALEPTDVSPSVPKPDTVEARKGAAIDGYSKVVRAGDIVKAIVPIPVPKGAKGMGEHNRVMQTIKDLNKDLAKAGFGILEDSSYHREMDTDQVIPYEVDPDDPAKTEENYWKAVDRAMETLHKLQHKISELAKQGKAHKEEMEGLIEKLTKMHIVSFAAEMEDGPQLAGKSHGKYQDEANVTVIPDACTDYEYPDLANRGALARLIADCRNTGDQSGIRDIKDHLSKIAENSVEGVNSLEDLFKYLFKHALRMKTLFETIADWQRCHKDVMKSI